MQENLERIQERYDELTMAMATPEVTTDYARLAEYGQERAELEPIVTRYQQYKTTLDRIAEAREFLQSGDDEMGELARGELAELEPQAESLAEELRRLLLPKDPRDERNVIIEIRAGAGGDEAGLFAADLTRMYTRHAERYGWKTEILDFNETGVGGYKEIVLQISGRGAYSHFKYESGVHRVQRVPATEASGRIHTSTATVAVLPEMDEIDVQIDPADLIIENYCSSGPGGQHMQKNATAVRIIHKPSGLVVTCENQRSQTQNRIQAMSVLRSRLYDIEQQKAMSAIDEQRRSQVGSGDRSEKIRTYNYPQNRITDHRVGISVYHLETVLDGALEEFIEALAQAEQAERLASLSE